MTDHSGLVFPSIRSNRLPLSENALNSALRRMGYTKEEMTAHGFGAGGHVSKTLPAAYSRRVIITRNKLIERAQNATGESKYVDFKRQFDIASTEAWCEVIKDIIAMANSGGGIIVFGVETDGASYKMGHATLLAYDTADITNRIAKYTNYQFSEIEVVEIKRSGKVHAAFLISAAEVPLVFTKPGTYEVADRKQKTAFAQGTIYFRHGSKSEHGNRDDLSSWREKEIARARKTWLGGIRKVVEAEPDDTVTVISSSAMSPKYGSIVKAVMSADPSAMRIAPTNAEEIWPHRQKDLIREVNKKIGDSKINSHDILCVKNKFDILKNYPEFAYKSHRLASPQYSNEFAEWLVDEYNKNKSFFLKAREEHSTKLK